MKNLKKLSVVFMIATLFSASFTSCIDNEVSPVVEAIYEAQADLIAAQAAVQQAEAALLEAQAAAEQAQAALLTAQAAQVNAITAGIIADNAYEAAVREQELRALVADTDLAVAEAQFALELAQAQFDLEMQELLAELEAAGVQLATQYAFQYRDAMNWANMLMGQLLDKQAELAHANLMLKSTMDGDISWEFYLQMLANDLAAMQANLAERNATQAEVEALIADGGTVETQFLEALRAERDELEAMIVPIQQQRTALRLTIDEKYTEWFANNDVISAYLEAEGKFEDAKDERDALVEDNEDLQEDIDMWQEWLDNYDTTEAALQAAVDAAQAAYDAAVAAEALAEADSDAADAAHAAAVAASDAADLALSDLEGEIALLYASLQTAITDLADEQALYDAGIGAATLALTDAQTDVATANANLTLALAEYNSWKTIFENDPAGSTWFEEVSPLGTLTVGADGYDNDMIGDHTDVDATSYAQVLTWTELVAGSGEFFPATYDTNYLPSIPADNLPLEDYEEFTSAGYPNGINTATPTVIFFVEVESDDVAETNEDLLNAAVAALGNEDIFDNPPVLGDGFIGDGVIGNDDAYIDLWDAQLAEIQAQDYLDNFGNDLADAQEEYDYWKNLYENQLALLDAAQAAAATAAADEAAALDAATAAQAVETAAEADVVDAQADLTAAEGDLTTFQGTTKEDLQDWIDANLATIADNDLYIAEYEIFMAEYQAEMDALQAEYDALMETPLNAAAFVEIESLWQEYFALGNEVDVIEDRIDILNSRIWIYQSWYDVPSIEDLQQVLADWIEDTEELVVEIALLEAQIATEEVNFENAQNRIALLEAQIETILARHANALAIAAKYKALMEAALAS